MNFKYLIDQYYEKNSIEGKPYEDYILIDEERSIYVLLDGVSRDKNGKYPVPSPSAAASKFFAHAVVDRIANKLPHYEGREKLSLLIDSSVYCNDQLKKYNSRKQWSFLPGTVGIVSIIYEHILYYCYIGDCILIIIRDETLNVLSREQTTLIAKNRHLFSSETIRQKICNNPEHPFSYGVFNGDAKAARFLESGSIRLQENDIILLLSDGFKTMLPYLQSNIKTIFNYSLKDLIYKYKLTKKATENDDMSIISIKVVAEH